MRERRRDNPYKVFVKVRMDWGTDGKKVPFQFREDDGPTIPVKMLHAEPAASLKAGGHGMRYTCQVKGPVYREIYLFLDGEYWFIEKEQLYGLYGEAYDGGV